VTRRFALAACVLVLVATTSCTKSSTEPSKPPALTFVVTPNPVPHTGIATGCAGSTTALKTWNYTLRINNVGEGTFVPAAFSARVSGPGLPAPIDTPYPASQFAAAFGTSSIAPQGSVTGQLCVTGEYDSRTLVWTFTDANGGGSFTSPTIQFLPS
jgi:hypothetical protein